jgi:two-component system CheB/CheR fusion protein
MKKRKSSASISAKKKAEKRAVKKSVSKSFPVVGIGASAGGVQAFTTFLNHLDPHLGMAYVLVMHLSPNHKSALAEIVQSKTKMPVQTIKDGMEVKPDNVYVIPPGTFMKLVDGHLELAPSVGNFAIDYFFSALASVYKNNAIGVILSGTATDGTLGLKSIKAEGGITFAQDETAEFRGMPQSAYDSGYVDFLLPPGEIANELARLVKVPYTILASNEFEHDPEKPVSKDNSELRKILAIVKRQTGIDFFQHYKHASVCRRLMRRMALNKVDALQDYHSLLQTSAKEVEALYDDFLINVTSFFRDPEFYTILTKQVFPSIIKQLPDLEPIRIWVAGCSTGEEAYSVAICLIEFLEANELAVPVQIFASDLDSSAIEKARLGIYTAGVLQGVSQNRLKKYFTKIDSHYQIIKSVREVCVFSQQNLLRDPPFSRMHLISCQNVLIYLETAPQKKILHTFHYALKPSGYLFLGKSETIGTEENLFDPLHKKIKVFSRNGTSSPHLDFTINKATNDSGQVGQMERVADTDPEKAISKLLLSRFVYPSVVVNKNLIITQFFGQTSQYLEPVAGKASFNILKMVKEELVIELGTLLQHARKTGKSTCKEGISIQNDKVTKEITIEVLPRHTSGDKSFLIVFKDEVVFKLPNSNGAKSVGDGNQKDRTILKLEEELVRSRGLIRSTNEEYETTYEELQANNEEILSSNEELQSVNEELETSKEELQSAVEELTSTNEELRKRNNELDASQRELKDLNEQLEHYAFVSSHDLQEPLRKIMMFSNLMSGSKANLNAYGEKYKDKINASAFRLSSLLKDLLNFSTIINHEENFTSVDLNDTLKDVLKDFDKTITAKEATINIPLMPVIEAEPIQMNQLFHSLISNALKFNVGKPVIDIIAKKVTPEGSPGRQPLKPDISYAAISVKDNGIGFDEMYLDKIFNLFQRLGDKAHTSGTGLGLAICKKIIKNHRGFIFAKSKKNKGSTFTVFLPMTWPAADIPAMDKVLSARLVDLVK